MPSTNQDILDAMESVARESPMDLLHQAGMPALAITSIAMSLKRIADNSDRVAADYLTVQNFVQNMAWEAGRSFARGQRTDR